MYNLTVDEAHTFFVGDGQWLVHNCSREQAEAIADHAFNKHFAQQRDLARLGVSSPAELADVIEQGVQRALTSPIGDKVKILDANRTAYFDPLHNSIIIVDTRPGIPGTIFKPDGGFKDFLKLR
jgi:hypothetical protein